MRPSPESTVFKDEEGGCGTADDLRLGFLLSLSLHQCRSVRLEDWAALEQIMARREKLVQELAREGRLDVSETGLRFIREIVKVDQTVENRLKGLLRNLSRELVRLRGVRKMIRNDIPAEAKGAGRIRVVC